MKLLITQQTEENHMGAPTGLENYLLLSVASLSMVPSSYGKTGRYVTKDYSKMTKMIVNRKLFIKDSVFHIVTLMKLIFKKHQNFIRKFREYAIIYHVKSKSHTFHWCFLNLTSDNCYLWKISVF